MTRKFLLCGAFAMVAAFAFSTAGVRADNMMMAAPVSMTGVWDVQTTGNEFQAGKLHLTQHGNTIVGWYGANKEGQFSGTMGAGNKVSATWKSPRGAGWLTLTVNANGKGFGGTWGYNGRKSNGNIVGTKEK